MDQSKLEYNTPNLFVINVRKRYKKPKTIRELSLETRAGSVIIPEVPGQLPGLPQLPQLQKTP